MKRRRFANFILALALLPALAGCTPEVPTPTPSPTPAAVPTVTPAPAKDHIFALPCYPEAGFHPITGTNRTNLLLSPLVYEGLFALDGSFTPQKQLCADYTVSGDGLTWNFTLAEDFFSDGSPLTAGDAAYSLNLARGKGSVYAARFKDVAQVSARSDGTLTVTLRAPNGNLPALLDVPIIKEAGEDHPPLGTGDYVLTSSGEDWQLHRVAYSAENASLPAEIPLRSIRQTDDLIYAFDTQNISLVSTDLTGTNTLGYSGSFESWDYPTSIMLYVGFNAAKGSCSDQKVRQALLYGFDRATVATSLLSRHAQAAALPVSPASPLYDGDLAASLDFSHQTMEDLLDDAGWVLTDGVRTQGRKTLSLTFIVNTENSYKLAVAEYLAQGLERAGISVELQKLTWEDYTAALAAGRFDLYLGETRLTADFDLSALISPGGALNYGGYRNGETDALLSAFLAAGADDRPAAAAELYAHLAQTAPFVPLCFKSWSVLTHWGTLSGLAPTQQNVFYRFDQWRF